MSILELNINNGLAEFIAPINIPLIVGTISAIDGTVIGKLSSEDVNNPTRPGRFSDDYSLVDVTARESVSISLTSGIFDTYLQLIDADTQEVIDFNDDSGGTVNSLLTFVPEAGINYIVRVTSFSGGVTGEYTLSATNRFPDLVVSEIIAPDTAVSRSTINISWTVTNQGTEATTTTWDDYIYFSTDEFFDNSDAFLDFEFITNPLAAGESYTRDLSVFLSSFGLEAGEGYLLVVSDRFDDQPETDEDNNVTVIGFTLEEPELPDVDLVVSEIIVPDTVALGSTIDISCTVTNQGTQATTATWSDYIYFSTDEFFDSSDAFLDSEFVFNPLAGGESYTRDGSVFLSSFGLEAGESYLLVVTDRFDNQPETDEGNNVTAVPITLTFPDVDLVVSEIIAPGTAALGSTINISWTVTNQGTEATTTTWDDEIYFSTDEFFDSSDAFLDFEFITNPVAAGESYTRDRSVFLSSFGLEAGEGYLLVVSDRFDDQPETDENNNVTAIGFTLEEPELPDVDLVVSEIIAPDTVALGSSINISWTVINQGTQAATAFFWSDYIYFSTDEFFDSSDAFLDSEFVFNPLAGGESYTRDRSISIPTFPAAGEGYLLVVTDRFDAQPETDENNNVTAIGFTLVEPEPPDVDLVVSEIIAPDTAALGSTIDVSWVVTNQGTGATTAFFWNDEIYFSSDEFLDDSDTFLNSESVFNPVAGGESYTVEKSVFLSSSPFLGLEVGNGYLLIKTDSSDFFNSQPETDEENNLTAVPFTITPLDIDLDVDLVVSEIIAPDTATLRSTIDISWTVTNQGTDTATASWNDSIYFSTDEFLDSSDAVLDFEFITNPIAGGESYTDEQSVVLSSFGLEAGEGYLLVVTDSFDEQLETNEDNNVTAIGFTLLPVEPPDVDLTIVDATATLNNSGTIDLTWTVVNQGTETAVRGFDSFFLSEDANFDRGVDRFITSSFDFPPLEGGSTETFQRLDLVSPAPNDRYLIVVTDFTDSQLETDETNNVFAALINFGEIAGSTGADELVGTPNDDTIVGNQGKDTLTGNEGSDRFVYNSIIDAGDRITDFESGIDTIILTGVLDGLGYTGSDPISDRYVRFKRKGDNTFIRIDPDGLGSAKPRNFILVEDVSVAELNNSVNFEF